MNDEVQIFVNSGEYAERFFTKRKQRHNGTYIFKDHVEKERFRLVLSEDGHFKLSLFNNELAPLPLNNDLKVEIRIGNDFLITSETDQSEDSFDGLLSIKKSKIYKKKWRRGSKIKLSGQIDLSNDSDGINPPTEKMDIKINGLSLLPIVSPEWSFTKFKRTNDGYIYKLVHKGSFLRVSIKDSGLFSIQFYSRDKTELVISEENTITLIIGNDKISGTTKFKEVKKWRW